MKDKMIDCVCSVILTVFGPFMVVFCLGVGMPTELGRKYFKNVSTTTKSTNKKKSGLA